MIEELQSAKNPRVKEWKKLLSKKGREQSGTYLIEGEHLVEEALEAGELAEVMIVNESQLSHAVEQSNVAMTKISPEISKMISATETPQGIFGICKKADKLDSVHGINRVLLLDGVQDPGNIGTMIRTADAAGMDAVIMGQGTGDLYNPKVIRSAQGSHFHLKIGFGDLSTWISQLKLEGISVYGSALENASPHTEVSPAEEFALIVGNEGAGIQPRILEETDANLYIPIYGKSESLNVAVAAGILMYHLRKTI